MGYYSDMPAEDLAKLPILQGPEGDYGEFDYLITDIPEDYCNRRIKFEEKWPCECCKKYARVLYQSEYHFYTYDGWDSMSQMYCKKCAGLDLQSRIKRYKKELMESHKKKREERWDRVREKRGLSKYNTYWQPYYFFEGKYCDPLISKKKFRRVVRQIRRNIWMTKLGHKVDPWHKIDYKKLLK